MRTPPYSGEKNVRVYEPIFEGALNDSGRVWLCPGPIVTVPVANGSGVRPLPCSMRLTVITSVIPLLNVELLFR